MDDVVTVAKPSFDNQYGFGTVTKERDDERDERDWQALLAQ